MSGETLTNTYEDIPLEPIDIDKLKEAAEKVVITNTVVKKKKVLSESEEDEEDEFEEDEDGNLTRTDEILQLDDEYDDTFGDMPEGYIISTNNITIEEEKEEEEEDEWGF